MRSLRGVFILLLLSYVICFTSQERQTLTINTHLDNALPLNFYRATSGFIRQLAAEILFIKASAFLGGAKHLAIIDSYANILGNNFDVMTSLYPQFHDPYYFCEAFLPSISQDSARKTNSILETGIDVYPNDFILRFFNATNFILYLNDPLNSSKAFAEAAKLPNAPTIFGHLAAVFSAQGGDIVAGLITLKTLQAAEKDEGVRSRYQVEILIFEQAIQVNDALIAYQKKYNAPPDELKQLAPEFIPEIPDIKDGFILVYDKPALRLVRPTPLK